ncbi:efflux RND transporter periplasmic adaptor subunit [Vallitalea okinawensis]|uniref:efflux RND transporter periplasmic adaptor subunit n=1 Tax=Vallitalea okinawensis TaxID=2078660 RepID=UPI000CFC02E0|nr:biotin/lipoyl-binding protein [Vallitalea okinawensis]
MVKKYKLVAIIAGVILCLLGGAAYYLKPVTVAVKTITSENLQQTVIEDGEIKPVDSYAIFSEVAGNIETIYVKDGQWVKEGDPLLKLNTDALELNKSILEERLDATILSLESQLDQLRNELAGVEQQHLLMSQQLDTELDNQTLILEDLNRQKMLADQDLEEGQVLFKEGGLSEDLLNTLDEVVKSLNSQIQQLENGINSSKQQMASEETSYKSNQSFLTTQIALLEGQIDASSGEINMEVIEGELTLMNDQIEKSLITAKKDGQVTEFLLEEGMSVGLGTLICNLINEEQKIDSYIYWEDALYLEEGMEVIIRYQRREQKVEVPGKITYISPTAYKQVSALGLEEERVKVEIQSDEVLEGMKPGYKVDIIYRLMSINDVFTVPETAVMKIDGQDAVYVIEDDKVVAKEINKGIEIEKDIVISGEVNEGDRVIVELDLENYSEGQRVKAK